METTMQLNDFPMMSAGIAARQGGEGRATRIDSALKVLDDALAAGGIMKIRLEEAKFTINNAIEDGWYAINDRYVNAGKFRDLGEIAGALHHNLNTPQIHVAASYLKRAVAAQKKLGGPDGYVDAVVTFLTEIQPIVAAVDNLKGKIVKREPKNTDPYEKYRAPAASLGAIGKVKAALEEIFEGHRVALTANYRDYYTSSVDAFLKLNTELRAIDPQAFREKSKEDQKVVDNKFQLHTQMSRAVMRFLNKAGGAQERPVWVGDNYTYDWVKPADIDAQIAAEAEKDATAARDNFVMKNLMKFDSIVDKKKNLATIKIISHNLSLSGLEGTLKVSFEDGSSFVAKNQIVWSHSVLGKEFTRAPLTFHNVILPNGQNMPRPSEQRMNEVFVKA
jgi:hypothetical protein